MRTIKHFLKKLNLPIRIKFAIVVSILIAFISIFIYIFFPEKLEKQAMNAIAFRATNILDLTAFGITPALYFGDKDAAQIQVNALKQNEDLVYIVVTGSNEDVFLSYNLDVAEKSEYRRPQNPDSISSGDRIYKLSTSIIYNKKELGHLYIGFSLERIRAEIISSRITIAIISIIIFIVSIIVIFYLSTVITAPLRDIAKTTDRIAKGDLSQRADVQTGDEVGMLAGSFNLMVENLQSAYNSLEQLNLELENKVIERTSKLQKEIQIKKKTAKDLKESEQKYRVLFEAAPDGVEVLDRDGFIIDCNSSYEKLLGYDRDRIVGKHTADFFTDECRRSFMEKFSSEGYKLLEEEVAIQTRDEDILHVWRKTSPIYNLKKQVVGAVNYNRDITKRKRDEAELLKSQKLESIALLAGGIAHDLNNILASMLLNISLAKNKSTAGSLIEQLLDKAEKASKRATNLVGQLLTFTREGSPPIKSLINFRELLKENVEFCLAGSKIDCNFIIDDNLWSIDADERQVSQVINNLIINAKQAMPDGGKITLKAFNIKFKNEAEVPVKPGHYVKVSIIDKGIGIPEENISKIFDPYFSTKEGGSGLGLFVCYRIINQHNGYIAVDSIPGKGSVFYFYLPASDATITEKLKTESDQIIKGTGKILVMDDDEFILSTAKECLNILGYESALARNGEEALDIYQKSLDGNSIFNAVILDLTVRGGMGGKETIEKLLKMDKNVRAIVSSGYSKDPIMSDYQKYGFSAMLVKPYRVQQLSSILSNLITGNSA